MPNFSLTHNQKKLLICLEGLSGTGKSTIGSLLSEKTGFILEKTPPQCMTSLRDAISSYDSCTSFLFYLSGVFAISHNLKNLAQPNGVILDRYVTSTFAYHQECVLARNLSPDSLPIAKPTFTFLLSCDENTRIKRLEAREARSPGRARYRYEIERLRQKQVMDYYQSRDFIPVNTNGTPEQSVQIILNKLMITTNT